MLSVVCAKQKANRCANFLLADFSPLLILVVIPTLLAATLLNVVLQQQATAYSMKIINTATTDPVDVKTLISNNDFLSYQNRALGVMMQYPSNWEKIDEDGKEVERHAKNAPDQATSDDPVVEFLSPLEASSSDKYQEALGISVHKLHTGNRGEFFGLFDKPTSQKILLHGFVLSHITSLIAKLPSFDLIKSESGNGEITLADGSLGHKIVYTYKEQGQVSSNSNTHLKVMEILTVSRDRGYIIRYSSEPFKYNIYLPTVQRMISSFRVTP
jgi:hypothetical protein